MSYYKSTFIFMAILLASCAAFRSNEIPVLSEPILPGAFIGKWGGELKIYKEGKVVKRVPMLLEVVRRDSLTLVWKTTYSMDDNPVIKDYLLRTWDASTGQYEIDENNGIILPATLSGERLTSVYAVMDQLMTVSHSLVDNKLRFQIDVCPDVSNIITGDTILNNDTIPPVTVYPVIINQSAVLERID
jgi:hypothetical protein